MTLSPSDWHCRYTEQARWTANLRRFVYSQVQLTPAQRVLEVGCGTGAVLSDFTAGAVGIDLAFPMLVQARQNAAQCFLACANAYDLPFTDRSFDLALCHFLLLWVRDPIRALHEMVRVTRPFGTVMALAEPDYGGRIDYPPALEQVGAWQAQSLRSQGANPDMGRQLAALFHAVGLKIVQVGVLGGQWTMTGNDPTGAQGEWQVINSDIASLPQPPSAAEVHRLQELDAKARQIGERVLFVPTFYAWGLKP